CPNCGHRTFVPFLDTETGEVLIGYGRCDREIKCGYFRHPKDGTPVFRTILPIQSPKKIIETDISKEFEELPNNFENDELYRFLCTLFPTEKVKQLFEKYKVKNFLGYTAFPQIDGNGTIWNAKLIKYKSDGHRDKSLGASWLHSYFKKGVSNKFYFGWHLVKQSKKVFVVESEKTALICNLHFGDEAIFIATGGVHLLRPERLQNFDVVLIPDADAVEKWARFGFPFIDVRKLGKLDFSGFDIADIIISQTNKEGL
ncbi:MAG: DUF6371 domain-containing protein, partial [Ignavibacteria bacterium]|nr:DUF6371 domain-containing protein [Ignavibacteria bacterium]